LHATARADTGETRRRWIIVAVIVYTLSLLSKPSGLTLPFVLLVLDVYPLGRLGGTRGSWLGPEVRPVWLEKLPFLPLAVAAGVLALIGKEQSGMLASLGQYGLIQRIMQSICALAFYLWKTAIPFGLSVLYELPVPIDVTGRLFLVSSMAVIVLTVLLYFLRRRWTAGLASWVCYLLIAAPVTGIFQNGPQLAADRYSYISCLPWAVLAGAGLFYCLRAWMNRRIGKTLVMLSAMAAALLVIVLAGLTWKQTKVWYDSEAVWRHAISVDHSSFLAHQFLGAAFFESGKSEEAIKQFRRTLEINPDYVSAYVGLGNTLLMRGDITQSIQFYRQALKIDPDLPEAHYNLARALATLGDTDKAINQYNDALKLDPAHADTHNNLGLLLASRGDIEGALSHFHEALRIDPTYAKAYYNVGRLLLQQGRASEATDYLTKALKLQPGVAEIHESLARALVMQGRREEALKHFEEAVSIMKESQR
jgi:protein O-mannosyl-transferase